MSDHESTEAESSFELDDLSDDGVQVVAGMIIETRAGQGPFVACRLEKEEAIEIVGGDGDCRLAAVWTAESGRQLELAAQRLIESEQDIIGIFPTFVGRDEAEDTPPSVARARALKGILTAEDEGP